MKSSLTQILVEDNAYLPCPAGSFQLGKIVADSPSVVISTEDADCTPWFQIHLNISPLTPKFVQSF